MAKTLTQPLYEATAPRPLAEAVAALTSQTGYPAALLLDAMRTYLILVTEWWDAESERRRGRMSWSSVWGKDAASIDRARVVPGQSYALTYPEAIEVLSATFGPVDEDENDTLAHLVTDYRDNTQPILETLTDVFLRDCALVLRGGWGRSDQWLWWTRGTSVSLPVAAEWIARWGKKSLNACIAVRMTERELVAILLSERLPDPEVIALMVVLLYPEGIPSVLA